MAAQHAAAGSKRPTRQLLAAGPAAPASQRRLFRASSHGNCLQVSADLSSLAFLFLIFTGMLYSYRTGRWLMTK